MKTQLKNTLTAFGAGAIMMFAGQGCKKSSGGNDEENKTPTEVTIATSYFGFTRNGTDKGIHTAGGKGSDSKNSYYLSINRTNPGYENAIITVMRSDIARPESQLKIDRDNEVAFINNNTTQIVIEMKNNSTTMGINKIILQMDQASKLGVDLTVAEATDYKQEAKRAEAKNMLNDLAASMADMDKTTAGNQSMPISITLKKD